MEKIEIIEEHKTFIRATVIQATHILFEKLLLLVEAEMDAQRESHKCEGFKYGGILNAENGQTLKIEIIVTPPTLPTTPSYN